MIFLTLPYPPSVNTYWGFKGSHRYLTKKAITFKSEVHYQFINSKQKSFGGEIIKIKIRLHPPDKRIRDIDNCIKSLLDALCQAGVFVDDSQIHKLEIEKSTIVKNGACTVIIEKY